MDDREKRHRAEAAHQILTHPIFIEAMNAVLALARDDLETVDPSDVQAISRLQGRAWACHTLEEALQGIILAKPADDAPAEEEDPLTGAG